MFAKILSKIAGAIRRIWGLFKTTFLIALFAFIGFFLLLTFFPESTSYAVDFIKNMGV